MSENLRKTERLLQEVREKGATLALLPESFPLPWLASGEDSRASAYAAPEDVPTMTHDGAEAGHGHRGTARCGGRRFSTTFVISEHGDILMRYRKNHIPYHVRRELQGLGVAEVLRVSVPYGQIHVDSVISPVDRRRLIMAPWLLTRDLRKQIHACGFELTVAEDLEEVGRLGTNFVAVGPGGVVMVEGFPRTLARLRSHDIEVHLVPVGEILRGGGSVHCLTGVL